mgnify:CR=1 FL=1
MCSSKNSSINRRKIIFQKKENKKILFCLLLSVIFLILFLFSFDDFNGSGFNLVLTFAGDAIPHYMIRSIIDSKGEKGILDAFYFVKNYLNSDASFFNLETTITDKPNSVKPYHFSVEPVFLNSINKIGFTHYTIANNHSLDYGEDGFIKTLSFIDKNRATGYMEDGQISYLVFSINDIKIAFFSFTTLSNYPVSNKLKNKPVYIENCFENKELINLIEKLDKQADILIAGIHWGSEYQLLPDESQKKIARFLIDKGVDIIWGSHPHVIQPFEIYNDKLILYSCANLISGQAYNIGSKEETDFHQNYFYTRAVPIIRVFFGKDKKLVRIELIPFFQLNNFFVRSKMESYFTTLIPTKYFVNDSDNPSQKIFFNYFQKDELSEISQDVQNKGEKLYFFEYIKNNLLDKKTIKNIILANNILYNTFFYNYLDKNNENEIKNYDKILQTEDSYIFER